MTLVAAWIGAILVGVTLGLLGSGGAILTVPILTFLVGHGGKSAIIESLAIVGTIACASAIRAGLARRLDLVSALALAVPGILGTWAGAAAGRLVDASVQLVVLSILMLSASAFMLRGTRGGPNAAADQPADQPPPLDLPNVLTGFLLGVGLGFLTGFVGVGGGFLIVPVLVLFRRLPMGLATGTSLMVIAINSGSGLAASLWAVSSLPKSERPPIDWQVVAIFAALGVVGSLGGSWFAGRLPDRVLRRMFAAFLVLIAIAIVLRQVMPAGS